MSPEVALLAEVWGIVKNHIHVKERIEVAESILECFDENVDIGDIDIYQNEFDSSMKVAIRSHFGNEDDDLDEDWE